MATETLLAILLAATALCPGTVQVTEEEIRRAALKAQVVLEVGPTPAQLARAASITCGYGSRRAGKRLLREAREWRNAR